MAIWDTIGNIAKTAAGFIPGVGPLIQGGLSVLGGISGAKSQGEANEITRNMLANKEAERAAREPFREQLLGRLGSGVSTQGPDLSSMFQTENPFGSSVTPPPPGLGPINPGLTWDKLPPGLEDALKKINTGLAEPSPTMSLGFADRLRAKVEGMQADAPTPTAFQDRILGTLGNAQTGTQATAATPSPTAFRDRILGRLGQ